MKPALSFHTKVFAVSPLGPAASIPDLPFGTGSGGNMRFFLDEYDELFEGYGRHASSYPYRQYTCYNRILESREMVTAVLENDFLKAVFLPGLGGRLWSLTDKRTGENLLYTNDVIRPGNLAIRGAWVSGGVEWNIGLIGHSPFTMEQIFTARLTDENGLPILRMYEYERIRKVTFQMDFWLEEDSDFLHCRMRIFNQTAQVVPMYWWSNMAAPEYEGGRVIAPAEYAYTNPGDGVRKVQVPRAGETDVSFYQDIPGQLDYFFDIPETAPKYIANLNREGYGLLHMSTGRLRSRKLFSWGNNEGSDNWQDFLTKDAGRYVEIQAGLGKTQYGCIPMPPHTAWEWLELYGPVRTSPETAAAPYRQAESDVRAVVNRCLQKLRPEETLTATRSLAKKKGELLFSGSEYAAFENVLREYNGETPLPEQLDFSGQGSLADPPEELSSAGHSSARLSSAGHSSARLSFDGYSSAGPFDGLSDGYKKLADFLKTGIFPEYSVADAPHDFLADDTLHRRLADTIGTLNKDNWYAHYQLGLSYFMKENPERAKAHLLASNSIKENPWALHALAVLAVAQGNEAQAASAITAGYAYRKDDLSYLKETWKILLRCHSYDTIIALYERLPGNFREESRIRLGYLQALSHTGRETEVLEYLEKTDFVVDDLREGEDTLGELWKSVYRKVYGEEGELPRKYNFHSL